jgi:hypothetical protein
MAKLAEVSLNEWPLPAKISPVPNAPCGVESLAQQKAKKREGVFLMHRVELKAR